MAFKSPAQARAYFASKSDKGTPKLGTLPSLGSFKDPIDTKIDPVAPIQPIQTSSRFQNLKKKLKPPYTY